MKQAFTLNIPAQLTQLCALLETTPEAVLQGFINDVSQEVQSSNGSDERAMAAAYFMRVGYGNNRYGYAQIEEMFWELDALRRQWPGNDAASERAYQRHRKTALAQWFRRWQAVKR